MSWYSISDDQQLTANDQIRVNISYGCAPLSRITVEDIKNFLSQEQSVKSILDITEGWVDWVTLGVTFTCTYQVILNPQPGVTAGEIRNAMYTALNKADQTHTIRAGKIIVGLIEREPSGVTAVLDSIKPGPSTAITFAALAVIAVVGFIIFNKVAD